MPSAVAYYAATNTAVLTPNSLLALSSTYTVVVASGGAGVKDVAGNALTNVFTASFTTALPDTGGPTVIGVDPTNGAVGVNPATPVRVTFSEAMDPLTITNGITLTNSAGELVPSAVAYYATTNTAVLTPNSPLALSNTYTVVVASGAAGVKDVAGNELTSVFTASFTTTDEVSYSIWAASATPTTPSFFDPGDPNPYELGVKFRSATNGYVTGIRFYKGAGNDGLHVGNLWRNSDQALLASVPFGNETASGWQYQALTNPVAITANTTYVVSYHITNGRYAVDTAVQPGNLTVGVNNPPLRALAHNEQGPNGVYAQTGGIAFPTAGNGANYWVDVVFTAGFGPDTNGPTVVGVSPVNGAAGVSPATRVRVTFGEAMDPLTITNGITLTNSAGVLVPSAVAYYAATNTAVLTPNSLLEPGANYTVVVANGGAGVKDLAGNALTNIFTASFTTALPDTEGPMVSWVDPPNGAVGVSPATLVRVTFSEAMDPLTITNGITLSNSSGGLVASTVAYYGTTNTAVLTPLSPLGLSSTYRVVVANGGAGVKDVAGNALTNVFTASFTTTDQTEFSLWDEFTGTADGGDPNGVEVGLKFQSALSGYITGIRFYKSAGNTGTHVGNLWELDGTPLARVTFVNEAGSGWQYQALTNPVAILANTTYVVSYYAPAGHYSFTAGAFTSGVTNYPLRALSSSEGGGNGVFVQSASSAFPNQTFNSANYWVDVVFRTGFGPDTNGPTVVGVSPVNGAAGVSPATLVRVTFSEAMDPVSITNGITLTNSAGALVPSTVAYYAATNTAVLTPVSALALSTRYTVVVANGGAGVKDVAGNGLTNVFTASFTTVLADTNGPTVVGVSPVNGAAGVSPATLVRVTFSEAMDPVSITNGITLTNSAGALVPSTVAYYAATNTAVLTPDSLLALSTRYTVVVANGGAGVKDVAGNALTNVFTASFTTTDQVSYSIWAASATPATPSFFDPGDPNPYELGVKFQSEIDGYVTGIRFYKGAGNDGLHVGNLWRNSDQALLASVPFGNETASGWQYQALTNPVAIASNTTYVVSYHITNGRYAVDTAVQPGNLRNGVNNPPLHALTNSPTTPNGVFLQSATSAFPTNSANGVNYWVDVDVVVVKPAVTIASGLSADDKVYDGTTAATLRTNGSVVLNGVTAGDVVDLVTNGYVATFSSANSGTGIPMSVSGLSLGGADAWKYTLVQPTDVAADITPALLTVTAGNQSRVYGATNPLFTASYSGFVNGDTVSVLSGEPSLTTLATENSPVGGYPITAGLGTLSATNYAFSLVDGTLTIGQALLTVTADNQSRVYGATNPVFTASYSGFVNGDTASASGGTAGVLSGEPSLTTLATESSPVGAYPITAALGTLSATNYAFSFVNGTLERHAGVVDGQGGRQESVVWCEQSAVHGHLQWFCQRAGCRCGDGGPERQHPCHHQQSCRQLSDQCVGPECAQLHHPVCGRDPGGAVGAAAGEGRRRQPGLWPGEPGFHRDDQRLGQWGGHQCAGGRAGVEQSGPDQQPGGELSDYSGRYDFHQLHPHLHQRHPDGGSGGAHRYC